MPARIGSDECAALRAVPCFVNLSDDSLDLITRICRRVHFSPGSRLMTQDAIEEQAYILLRGKAVVTVATDLGIVEVAELAPGAFVGEIALLCNVPRTATVTAVSSVDALRLSRANLGALTDRSPGFAIMLMRALAERIEASVEAVAYFKAAAHSIQNGSFDHAALVDLGERRDEIGAFATAFAAMAKAVGEREAELLREVEALKHKHGLAGTAD